MSEAETQATAAPLTLCCPHCAQEFHVEAEARLPPETKLRFSITPRPGEMVSASTVGGTMTEMQKLLAAVGRSMGAKTVTLVEGLSTGEDGALHIDLRVLNAPKGFAEAVQKAQP